MPTLRFLALCALALVSAAAAAQPDVIVIVADDMGFNDVGYNGSEIQTPHIDALAREGIRLDRFYASPLCSPSRAGLLTGRYPVRQGINEPVTYADTMGLPPAEVTIGEYFQEAGYETAAVGKWHLGLECHQNPLRNGFDRWVGMLSGGATYFERETNFGIDWWRGYTPSRPDGYTTTLIADEAVVEIERARDGPLFLYLPFTAPHTPLDALPQDLALYNDLPEPRRTYAAMVASLDRSVGRIMDAVAASGRPTLVWFLSDNGGIGIHGGSNEPLAGQKGQTTEGGMRVPSVVWYPPWGSRRIDHPVWYLDILPTVLGLAPDAPAIRRPLDGSDVSDLLQGGSPTPELESRVLLSYRRTGDDGYWLAAQTAMWKYRARLAVPGGNPNETLYRIDVDPQEVIDVIDRERLVAAELRQQAEAYAELTLPGATHDLSLTEGRLPDASACQSTEVEPPVSRPGRVRVSPNPVSGTATVRVGAAGPDRIQVEVLDTMGRRVRVLFEGRMDAGGEIPFDTAGLPAGTYLVRVVGVGTGRAVPVVVVR